MAIQRKVVNQLPRRQEGDLIKKAEKIGKLLDLDPVPTHTLAWKEQRMSIGTGDCYPLMDVLERIAELVGKKPKAAKRVKDEGKKGQSD